MAKKKVQPASDEIEVIAPDVEDSSKKESKQTNEVKTKDSKTKEVKDVKSKDSKAQNKNAKNSKKKEKKSIKKKASEVWSELKKVSKPTFGTVVKNTCVVIAVVAICTLLLFGMDKLFSLIYDLLLP